MDKTKMHDEPNDATGTTATAPTAPGAAQTPVADVAIPPTRSEERRVGKEC